MRMRSGAGGRPRRCRTFRSFDGRSYTPDWPTPRKSELLESRRGPATPRIMCEVAERIVRMAEENRRTLIRSMIGLPLDDKLALLGQHRAGRGACYSPISRHHVGAGGRGIDVAVP
jgi:hypothetical protein